MTSSAVQTTAASSAGVWAPRRRRLTTGLVLTITLVAFESLAVSTVMPRVEDDLGGLALYGWVFSGFFLASLAGIVVTGVITDRQGPALPFGVGLVLFAVGLIVGGLAPSMIVLVAGRVAQGFGAGSIPAAAYASVAAGYPSATRPRVFAVFSTAWVVPGLVGPSLAALVEEVSSWRWVFLGLLPLVAVAGLVAVPALARLRGPGVSDNGDFRGAHSADRRAADRARLGNMALLVVGVGLIIAAGTTRSGVVAVALAVIGVPIAARTFVRLVPPGTVRLRSGLPAVVAVRGILTWAFFGVDAFISLAVTDGEGGSTFMAGAVLTATAVLWASGAWVQERWVGRVGPRRLDTIGFALLAASSVAMIVIVVTLPVVWAVAAWGIAGFAMGLGYAPLSVTTLALAESGREGEASASLQLCDVLGVSLGTGVGGAIIAMSDNRGWEVTSGAALAFAAGAVVAALGIFAARRLPARVPDERTRS